MGKNKLAKFDDMAAIRTYSNTLFAALQEKGFDMKGQWHERFSRNDHPIVLELGCGKGIYRRFESFSQIRILLVSISREHVCGPERRESLEAGMNNVAFLRTSIELISHFFAPGEVAEIWITFPDPQMKRSISV